MNLTTLLPRVAFATALLAALAGLGCESDTATRSEDKEPAKPPEAKKVKVGKNVNLEVQGDKRRVLIDAQVCLQKGPLELLLCRKQTKEHEAVLTAEIDARDVHQALLLAGAKPGSPVKFQPKLEPATGTRIKITLEYEQKGKKVSVPAQQWVRHMMTKKDLDHDWVFAGSRLAPNPFDINKPPTYLANEGDVICVANFDDALLDVPFPSSKEDADRNWEAHPDRVPPLETAVVVILEPVPEPKKPEKK